MDKHLAEVIAELDHVLGHVRDCERNCPECRDLATQVIAAHRDVIRAALHVFLEADE